MTDETRSPGPSSFSDPQHAGDRFSAVAGAFRFDAIVVSGGRASRLGGIDKTALLFDGRTLLSRSLDAVEQAGRISVVGPIAPARAGVSRTRETPLLGGPGAAVVAGLEDLRADNPAPAEFVVIVASDVPRVVAAVTALLDSFSPLSRAPTIDQVPRVSGSDGRVAIDSSGRRQPLLAVYRVGALWAAASEFPRVDGLSLRALLAHLDLEEFPLADTLLADVDEPDDAARLGIELPGVG